MGIRTFIMAAAIAFGATAQADITFTTFNIRWYGLKETLNGQAIRETRDPYLTEFIHQRSQVGQSDVIAFQEIVDVPRLRKLVPNHQCVSYDSPDPKHQHVVVCVKKPLRFDIERYDNNYTIEEIALPTPRGPVRPGVHGLLKTADGKPLAHVIALHLKAMPEETAMRLKQIDLLKRHIDTYLRDGIPVVMTGDYNTHVSSATRLPKDDYILMAERLAAGNFPMIRVDNPFRFTYRSGDYASHFDHYWVSAGLKPVAPPTVWIACNANVAARNYEDITFYNKAVSDHCPVTVKFPL